MRTASTASRDTLLIGHSMGAHAVLLAAAPNRTAIETVQIGAHSSTTVILLASPLRAPAVGLSSCSWRAHDTLRFHARQLRALPNVTVVSIDGGDRDLLVDPRGARLDGLIEDHVSLGDPGLQFAGVDHRAVLWCKQVVDGLVQGVASWRQGRGQRGQKGRVDLSLGEHIRHGIGSEAQVSSERSAAVRASLAAVRERGWREAAGVAQAGVALVQRVSRSMAGLGAMVMLSIEHGVVQGVGRRRGAFAVWGWVPQRWCALVAVLVLVFRWVLALGISLALAPWGPLLEDPSGAMASACIRALLVCLKGGAGARGLLLSLWGMGLDLAWTIVLMDTLLGAISSVLGAIGWAVMGLLGACKRLGGLSDGGRCGLNRNRRPAGGQISLDWTKIATGAGCVAASLWLAFAIDSSRGFPCMGIFGTALPIVSVLCFGLATWGVPEPSSWGSVHPVWVMVLLVSHDALAVGGLVWARFFADSWQNVSLARQLAVWTAQYPIPESIGEDASGAEEYAAGHLCGDYASHLQLVGSVIFCVGVPLGMQGMQVSPESAEVMRALRRVPRPESPEVARALQQTTTTSAVADLIRYATMCFLCVLVVAHVSDEQRPEEASFVVDADTVIEEAWRWGPQVTGLTAWVAFAAEALAKRRSTPPPPRLTQEQGGAWLLSTILPSSWRAREHAD